jgi:hypothetical protein
MEVETKAFDIRIIASITSGVLLVQDFSLVHEAIEWLAGYPVWTHELPAVCRRLAPELAERFPALPASEEAVGKWEECALHLLAKYPDKIELSKGSGKRERGPIETASAILSRRAVRA